ncbi:LuxR C-terminal-related transcriptional regulator [Pseudomonas sp. NPDC089569]|uniref:LuxR C-terminal-related transcriptional regulator n=1 Tax=Pseudomonas sp. NPDC089569 TaxID=3390722 RepID=UPI003D060356
MSLAKTNNKPGTAPLCSLAIVPRPRLRQVLLDSQCRVRLLCAPAGSGKTFLLRECARHCPPNMRLLWLDLKGQSVGASGLLDALAAQLGAAQSDLTGIQTCLEQQVTPLWLMLDDYPRSPDNALDSLLNTLLLSSSHRVQWWIASRRRPNCQLMRLLLERKLLELGPRELALTNAELDEVLDHEALPLAPATARQLLNSTGGWYAGVRMQLLGQSHGSSFEFARNDLLIERYLESEVLDGLSSQWREWLSTLACLPSFDAALCGHLLGAVDSGRVIRQLQETGLLIDAPDRQAERYCVQPAVARLLAARLFPEQRKALLHRACQWCIAAQQPQEAIEYALLAGQHEVAVSLLQSLSLERLLQGRELARVLHWLDRLPAPLLDGGSPELSVLFAWSLLLGGQLEKAQDWIDRLERSLPQPDGQRHRSSWAQWQVLTVAIACYRAQARTPDEDLQHALEHLAEEDWVQRLLAQATLIEWALGQGRIEQARQLIRSAVAAARRQGSLTLEALLLLQHSNVLEMRGELTRADTLLEHLQHELEVGPTDAADWLVGRTRLRRAAILEHLGRDEEAVRYFQSALEVSLECRDPWALEGYVGLAGLACERNDPGAAFAHLANATRVLQVQRISEPVYECRLTLAYAKLWLTQGQPAKAERALSQCLALYQGRTPMGHPELLPRMQLQLLQARLAAGRDVNEPLDDMLQRAQSQGCWPLACKLWLCLAQAFDLCGQRKNAGHALMEGLRLSRRLGLSGIERSFSSQNQGLTVLGQPSMTTPGDVRLSRRERTVLEMIAQGLSNREIAEGLHLSLHTVKSHAQKINTKLGVSRRTQAIAQAKLLGMVG